MIEVEQQGTLDDYFVFHRDYGVPETGVEFLVASNKNVRDKTDEIDYADLVRP